jgi:hypothetical protein
VIPFKNNRLKKQIIINSFPVFFYCTLVRVNAQINLYTSADLCLLDNMQYDKKETKDRCVIKEQNVSFFIVWHYTIKCFNIG